jgi:hypothetical protein
MFIKEEPRFSNCLIQASWMEVIVCGEDLIPCLKWHVYKSYEWIVEDNVALLQCDNQHACVDTFLGWVGGDGACFSLVPMLVDRLSSNIEV